MRFIFLILLISCSSLKQDPQLLIDIRNWNLAGKWVSDAGYMKINCNAAFEYYEANTFDNFGMGSSEKGGMIKKLQKDKLITGPIIRRTYKITKLPSYTEDTWSMVLNNLEWKREPNFPHCN